VEEGVDMLEVVDILVEVEAGSGVEAYMEQVVIPLWEDPEEVEDNGFLIVVEGLGEVGGLTGILTMYICAHLMQIVE
jgi:hypothetical protein